MSENGQRYCEDPIKWVPKEIEEINRYKPLVMLPEEYLQKPKGTKTVATDPRISRDQMFIDIAYTVAKRGTCNRARVGAVLVDNNYNIVSIGYNGAPQGEPHCDDVGHTMYKGHCVRTIHAEENCVNKLSRLNEGRYTLYVTHYPCAKCQITLYEKLMKNPGTSMLVIYGNDYGENTSFQDMIATKEILQFSHFKG